MNSGVPRTGSTEGLPDLTHEKKLYCSQTPSWTVFHKKALVPFSWLCANEEVGWNLWTLPNAWHSTLETFFETDEKQKKWSWVCTDVPCDSITFSFLVRNKDDTVSLFYFFFFFWDNRQVVCHYGKTSSSKTALTYVHHCLMTRTVLSGLWAPAQNLNLWQLS